MILMIIFNYYNTNILSYHVLTNIFDPALGFSAKQLILSAGNESIRLISNSFLKQIFNQFTKIKNEIKICTPYFCRAIRLSRFREQRRRLFPQ